MGLSLRTGLNVGVGTSPGGYSSNPSPSTASEAGFGPGYTAAGTPSTASALAPNDPFGVAFWSGVGAFAILLVIRHSLPKG